MKVLASLFVFIAIAQCYCPNECSGENGECTSADVCICFEGWVGDDCSLADNELINRQSVEGSVATRKWAYYHILANSMQSSLVFEINQTSIFGDIDAYVRFDTFPTKQQYDVRDISTSLNIRFEIPSPHGVYYLGIYGFLGADFSAMATLKTQCPNDCSGHGACNYNGHCECNAGYLGDDCSDTASHIESGVPAVGEVAGGEWVYYIFENGNTNTISMTLTQTVEGEDCDVYVKVGQVPTLQDFAYRDVGVGDNTELKISDAEKGASYYVGIFGFTDESHFSFEVNAYSECPNQCSGTTHGSCSSDFTCNCQRVYSGDSCETKRAPMVLDDTIESGHVSGNLWNYYHFETYTSNNVVLKLRQLNDDADCDLYIKQGENPSSRVFDYRDTSQDVVTEITLESPAINTWYVGVYGYASCDYQLSALVTQRCPNDCVDEEHGVCVKGHCECKEGWTSFDCSMQSNSLVNGVPQDGGVSLDEFHYFNFQAVPGTEVTVAVHEETSSGAVWLYQSTSGVPTLAEFDGSDTETNSAVHRISFTVPESVTVHIGVYGSILAQPGHEYRYQVVAWQAVFP